MLSSLTKSGSGLVFSRTGKRDDKTIFKIMWTKCNSGDDLKQFFKGEELTKATRMFFIAKDKSSLFAVPLQSLPPKTIGTICLYDVKNKIETKEMLDDALKICNTTGAAFNEGSFTDFYFERSNEDIYDSVMEYCSTIKDVENNFAGKELGIAKEIFKICKATIFDKTFVPDEAEVEPKSESKAGAGAGAEAGAGAGGVGVEGEAEAGAGPGPKSDPSLKPVIEALAAGAGSDSDSEVKAKEKFDYVKIRATWTPEELKAVALANLETPFTTAKIAVNWLKTAKKTSVLFVAPGTPKSATKQPSPSGVKRTGSFQELTLLG